MSRQQDWPSGSKLGMLILDTCQNNHSRVGGTFMEQTGHIKQDMRHYIRHGSLYRDKNSIHDKGHYT